MEKFIKVTSILFAIMLVFSCVYWSGMLKSHHFCIQFDDGTEYHISTLIDSDAENIYVYNFGSKYSIPINYRSYEIHYCNCGNSVANINEIKEQENENLH